MSLNPLILRNLCFDLQLATVLTERISRIVSENEPIIRPRYTSIMSSISESYRYIVRSPGVRSGNARVEGTRIGVHDVIGLLQTGETVDTLTSNCFPNLTKAQVYECLAYYEDHRGEIDLLVARQMAQASE